MIRRFKKKKSERKLLDGRLLRRRRRGWGRLRRIWRGLLLRMIGKGKKLMRIIERIKIGRVVEGRKIGNERMIEEEKKEVGRMWEMWNKMMDEIGIEIKELGVIRKKRVKREKGLDKEEIERREKIGKEEVVVRKIIGEREGEKNIKGNFLFN